MRQARAQQDELDAEDQPEGAIAQVLKCEITYGWRCLSQCCSPVVANSVMNERQECSACFLETCYKLPVFHIAHAMTMLCTRLILSCHSDVLWNTCCCCCVPCLALKHLLCVAISKALVGSCQREEV